MGIQTLIGLETQSTEDPLQGTSHLLEETLLHGKARSRRLWHYQAQRQNLEGSDMD